jgi:hypothetical protein
LTGAGWWLRSIVSGGRDLLDVPLDAQMDVSDVVVTFSDSHTELAGVLQTAPGQPAPGFVVVVFPEDPRLWRATRRVRQTRPATDGRFAFVDLPPGTYVIAAASDLPEDNWRTADVFEALAPSGVRVSLGEAEKKLQNLQIRGR